MIKQEKYLYCFITTSILFLHILILFFLSSSFSSFIRFAHLCSQDLRKLISLAANKICMRDFMFPSPSNKNCTLLTSYAASGGKSLPTFWDNLSVPNPSVKNPGLAGCTETSVRNYHYSLRNRPKERSSQEPHGLVQLRCARF